MTWQDGLQMGLKEGETHQHIIEGQPQCRSRIPQAQSPQPLYLYHPDYLSPDAKKVGNEGGA